MYVRNAATNVPFLLVNATSGADLIGATVSGVRTLDNGVQAAVTGTFTEKGNGQYNFAASAADMNGDVVGLKFSATNAISVHATIKTVPAAIPTVGTGANQIALTGGAVTTGTVTDKTGYNLATAPPTANAIADAVLTRDWAAVADPGVRCLLQAGYRLRNRWAVTATAATIYRPDDATVSYSTALATVDPASALVITGEDPA